MDYIECRYIGFGHLYNRLVCVAYTERYPDIIRIISFRKANNREKKSTKKVLRTDWDKVDKLTDKTINYSDIPEVTEEFLN